MSLVQYCLSPWSYTYDPFPNHERRPKKNRHSDPDAKAYPSRLDNIIDNLVIARPIESVTRRAIRKAVIAIKSVTKRLWSDGIENDPVEDDREDDGGTGALSSQQ